MTTPAPALLTAVGSGRTVAVTEVGVTFGGTDAEVPVEGVAAPLAFLDPVDEGFIVTDIGEVCAVNGRPVIGQRLAQVGDLLRVAGEEFRLEPAASAPSVVDPHPADLLPSPEPVDAPAPMVAESSVAEEASIADAEIPRPPLVESSALPPMARLAVLGTGILAGRTFPLVTRLTLVGRGVHNDVVLEDDTVSDSHAKIVRRATGWFVLDEGSSNGTYVAGRRIDGERGLAEGSEVRFGGIKVRFEPLDAEAGDLGGKGTRQVVARPRPEVKAPTPIVEHTPESSAPMPIPPTASPAAPRSASAGPGRARAAAWRAALGWILVTVVIVGCGVAGYLVAALLRGGR